MTRTQRFTLAARGLHRPFPRPQSFRISWAAMRPGATSFVRLILRQPALLLPGAEVARLHALRVPVLTVINGPTAGAGVGAVAMGISARRRRRTT